MKRIAPDRLTRATNTGGKMKRVIAIGNETGITKTLCPKCFSVMERQDGGYMEGFDGEYYQYDYADYWECPVCHYTEEE